MPSVHPHQKPPKVKNPEKVMMICDGCNAGVHLGCLPNKFSKHVPWIRKWHCPDCTQPCEVCSQEDIYDDPKKRLLMCSECSVFVHMHCLTSPLYVEPRGTWTCSTCLYTSQRRRTRFQAQKDFCAFCHATVETDPVTCSLCKSCWHSNPPCLQLHHKPSSSTRSWLCPDCVE